jgi:hypothetical protein
MDLNSEYEYLKHEELTMDRIINEIQIIVGPEFVFDITDIYDERVSTINYLTEIYFKFRPLVSIYSNKHSYQKITEKMFDFRLDEIRKFWFVEKAEKIVINKMGTYIHIVLNKNNNEYILK